jgi:hypothetical protein
VLEEFVVSVLNLQCIPEVRICRRPRGYTRKQIESEVGGYMALNLPATTDEKATADNVINGPQRR